MKLIKMLQRAHAIEIGAYYAYEGHWKSLPIHSPERQRIKEIQAEELEHRLTLVDMLDQLGAKPNKLLNAVFFVIGKSISFTCRFTSRRSAMWGAKIMERLGGVYYGDIASEAWRNGYRFMDYQLTRMRLAEENHEIFFKLNSNNKYKKVITFTLGGKVIAYAYSEETNK